MYPASGFATLRRGRTNRSPLSGAWSSIGASLQRTSCGAPTVQDVRETTAVRNRTSRGPPTAWIGCGRLTLSAGSIVAAALDLCDERLCQTTGRRLTLTIFVSAV
jgi:hypothetical protein